MIKGVGKQLPSSVTLGDISRQTGVDRTSISRILRGLAGEYRISAGRVRLVEKAAARLRYRPNAAARSTRTGRFGNVALLVSTTPGASDLHPDLIAGCHDVLSDQRIHLTVARIPDERLESASFMPHILRDLSVDGLLVNYRWSTPPQLAELIDRFKIPAIWLGSKRDHDAVYPDMVAAYDQAVAHLIGLGHRRIALVIVPHSSRMGEESGWHYSRRDSIASYRATMTQAGLAPQMVYGSAADVAGLFSSAAPPTAIVAKGLNSATVVWLAAAQAGVRVPRDLSILAVSAEGQPELTLPLTQISASADQLGRAGVALLLKKMEAPRKLLPASVLPVTWVTGETAAAVRS